MNGRALARLLALAGLLVFLFGADVPQRSRFWAAFFDAGHTPLFGVIALLIRGLLAARPGAFTGSPNPETAARHTSLVAFAATVFLGAATEVLQAFNHGDASAVDLLRDAAGAASFLMLADIARSLRSRVGTAPDGDNEGGRRPSPARLAGLRAVLAVGLLLAAGATLLGTTAAYLARNRSFPVLFPLDGSWWEREFVDTEGNQLTVGTGAEPASRDHADAGLARLDMRPGLYSGIAFEEPYPDWRGYKSLTVTIVSDLPSPLPMVIRVHDARHNHAARDRFNRALIVQPGTNRLSIPIDDIRRAPRGREMDLRRIQGIILFAPGLQRRIHLYLGPLQLE